MKQDDPLNSVLREWQAPDPPPAMDAKVRAAYRKIHRPSFWRRIWSAQITVPVPVLAGLLLVMAAVWFQFRTASPKVEPPASGPADSGYVSRLEAVGFQPLQNGATRVIRSGEVKEWR